VYDFDVFIFLLFVSYQNILKEQIVYRHFVDRRKKKIKERKASKNPNDYMARVYPSSFDDSWLVIANKIGQLVYR
jgi:hypothetical protein